MPHYLQGGALLLFFVPKIVDSRLDLFVYGSIRIRILKFLASSVPNLFGKVLNCKTFGPWALTTPSLEYFVIREMGLAKIWDKEQSIGFW